MLKNADEKKKKFDEQQSDHNEMVKKNVNNLNK